MFDQKIILLRLEGYIIYFSDIILTTFLILQAAIGRSLSWIFAVSPLHFQNLKNTKIVN